MACSASGRKYKARTDEAGAIRCAGGGHDAHRASRAPASRNTAERLSSVSAGNALELRGVTKLFGALAAISDVTLTVAPGERRAVLGSNGAGKTTLFNCVTGDFLPTSGTIRLFGEDVTQLSRRMSASAGACAAPTRSRCCSAA
jgi:ABC-type molybdenum transport system ATPase subunit/photorepair protein PhrA